MRQLMVRQKKVLDLVVKQNPEIRDCDDLPAEVWNKLVAINDTEILYQEVNRYLWDIRR